MWLFKPVINSDSVAIAFMPGYMACCLMQTNHINSSVTIKAFNGFPLTNYELEQQAIYNPTCIGNHVRSFFTAHNLTDVPVRISLHGPAVVEKFFTGTDEDVSPEKLNIAQLADMAWESTLITEDQGKSTYYICGMSRHVLFQYKLLAIQHRLNLTCISTRAMALLSAYSALESDMAQKLVAHDFDIEKIMETQSLRPLVPLIEQEQNSLIIKELVGLVIAEFAYENI
jgi:hypothetical protein